MTLAIDPCALQFCKPLIPQSKRSNDYLQLLIHSEVPAAEPFSNLHVNKQRQLHGSWPSQARRRGCGEWIVSAAPCICTRSCSAVPTRAPQTACSPDGELGPPCWHTAEFKWS